MPDAFYKNAQTLAQLVLDPISDVLGKLNINSWYRSQAVNLAAGGVQDSDHRDASAADVETPNYKNNGAIVATVLDKQIPFDQLIIYDDMDNPSRIHISYNRTKLPDEQRREILFKQGGQYYAVREADAYTRYL